MSKTNKNSFVRNIYNQIVKLLVTPLFNTIAKVLSHGATHFLFFFIITALTSYFWYQNSKVDITPHNIAFDIGWTNKYEAVAKKDFITLKDSISNLEIHLELNSQDAQIKTGGRYHNRLVLQFDGKGKEQVIPDDQKHPSISFVTKNVNQGDEDSVYIKLFSVPLLSDLFIDVKADHWVKADSVPDIKAVVHDSNSFSFEQVWGDGIYIGNSDTTEYIHSKESDDSIHVLKLVPKKYEIEGKLRSPKQTISLYSDDFGVRENNPYYYYFISFPTTRIAGDLVLDFKVSDLSSNEKLNLFYSSDKYLQFGYIFPEPDVVNNGYIVYNTKNKMTEIQNNHGVIIQATDINSLNKMNSKSFLYSVLIGTAIAFLLDIIIQLIRELRNLNNRNRGKNRNIGSQ